MSSHLKVTGTYLYFSFSFFKFLSFVRYILKQQRLNLRHVDRTSRVNSETLFVNNIATGSESLWIHADLDLKHRLKILLGQITLYKSINHRVKVLKGFHPLSNHVKFMTSIDMTRILADDVQDPYDP